jgi:hypothetical protein
MSFPEWPDIVSLLWKKLFNRDWAFTILSEATLWRATCTLVFLGARHHFCSGAHETIREAVLMLSVKIMIDLIIPYGRYVKSHDLDYLVDCRVFKRTRFAGIEKATYTTEPAPERS